MYIVYLASSVRMEKALIRLSGCTGSPKHLLVAYSMRFISSWACTIDYFNLNLIECFHITSVSTASGVGVQNLQVRARKSVNYFLKIIKANF